MVVNVERLLPRILHELCPNITSVGNIDFEDPGAPEDPDFVPDPDESANSASLADIESSADCGPHSETDSIDATNDTAYTNNLRDVYTPIPRHLKLTYVERILLPLIMQSLQHHPDIRDMNRHINYAYDREQRSLRRAEVEFDEKIDDHRMDLQSLEVDLTDNLRREGDYTLDNVRHDLRELLQEQQDSLEEAQRDLDATIRDAQTDLERTTEQKIAEAKARVDAAVAQALSDTAARVDTVKEQAATQAATHFKTRFDAIVDQKLTDAGIRLDALIKQKLDAAAAHLNTVTPTAAEVKSDSSDAGRKGDDSAARASE